VDLLGQDREKRGRKKGKFSPRGKEGEKPIPIRFTAEKRGKISAREKREEGRTERLDNARGRGGMPFATDGRGRVCKRDRGKRKWKDRSEESLCRLLKRGDWSLYGEDIRER